MIVRGRVQGVGYRWWAVREAERLGLDGWVRNCRDGSVELLAVGAPPALEALAAACQRGPSAAAVDAVEISDAEDDGAAGFRERATV